MTPARLGSGQRTRLSGASLLSIAALTFAGVMSMQAVTAPPISAGETAYRYWSFWVGADAPAGEIPPDSRNECAVVDEGSSLARALSSVSVIRDESGLICSFDGYPASECAPVMTVEASASSDSKKLGNSLAPDHGAASQGSGDNLSVQGVESSSPIRSVVFGAGAVTALFITIALLLTRHSSRRARRAP